MEHTKTDHGYHENSRAVKYLLEVLTELSPEERRKFLLWVTGSPRLPIGGTISCKYHLCLFVEGNLTYFFLTNPGWKDLVPKLTIVRKEATDRSHSDEYDLSSSLCFPFLFDLIHWSYSPNAATRFLPSVMTCFNYLKLPDYSTKSVLKDKLLLAINEGAEFHLS
jgi:E3 ubiquitin-protein ligase TRIP12